MTKKFAILLMAMCLLASAAGCSAVTEGKASWEVYCGVRHEKTGEGKAKVAIESTVVTKVVDWLTDGFPADGEITKAE